MVVRVASGKRYWESPILPLMPYFLYIEPYAIGLMEDVNRGEAISKGESKGYRTVCKNTGHAICLYSTG